MNCKNCDRKIEGNFCGNCGQSAKVAKISFKYLLNEIPDSIFQVNHGLLFTIKELFFRPGHSIREFLAGKRKKHFKPIAYVLLLSTIYVILASFIDDRTFLGSLVSGMADAAISVDPKFSSSPKGLNWIANNHAYTTLILLPFYSIASFLAFLRFNCNYFEHFVLNAYLIGQQAIIYSSSILLQILTGFDNYYLPIFPLILSIALAFWTFYQFFNTEKKFSIILLTILTYLLSMILILGLLTLIIWGSLFFE